MPARRAWRGGSVAVRDDQRVRGVPQQGVHMQPYSVLKVTDRAGNVLEENRPEPKDAIRPTRPTSSPTCSAAWCSAAPPPRPRRSTGRSAARRDHRRLHRCLVRRLRSGHHDRRLDRPRPEAHDRPQHDRRRSRAADLDRCDEGVDRRPQGSAPSSDRRQYRVRLGRQGRNATPRSAGAISEAFIAGTQPGGMR